MPELGPLTFSHLLSPRSTFPSWFSPCLLGSSRPPYSPFSPPAVSLPGGPNPLMTLKTRFQLLPLSRALELSICQPLPSHTHRVSPRGADPFPSGLSPVPATLFPDVRALLPPALHPYHSFPKPWPSPLPACSRFLSSFLSTVTTTVVSLTPLLLQLTLQSTSGS